MKNLKVFSAILVVLVSIICCGCISAPTVAEITGNDRWYYYNPVIGESEVLTLDNENNFYHNCQCGEPVDNSDVYDKYEYNEENSTITLYNEYDDFQMEYDVISMTPYHLILKIDGEIKVFTPEFINDDFTYFGGERYISGYNGYFSIMEVNKTEITVGPFNYDGDIDYEESAFTKYSLAAGATFAQLNIKTVYEDNQASHNTVYKSLSIKEANKLLANNNSEAAFIWLNDDLEITKVLFFGQTVIQQ